MVDLSSDRSPAGLDLIVGGRRIREDIGAGESLDVLPGRVFRLLGAGAGENHLLLQRQFLIGPKRTVHLPNALGIDDADHSLGLGRKLGDMMFGVHIQAADEDAEDRLEFLQRGPPLSPSPNGVTRGYALPGREDQSDVDRYAG